MTPASAEDIELLVRLVRRDHAGAERCLRTRRATLESFLDGPAARGLSAVVLSAVEDSPLRDAFPRRQLDVLQARRRQLARRLCLLLEALERLAARFETAGQPFILLKGPYLAARFHGDPQARDFVDLDLLVPRRDRERTFRLLAEAGYVPRSRVLLSTRLTCFFVHGFDFSCDGSHVDLHWCLSRHPSLAMDEHGIWERRQSYVVAGRPYDVLSDADDIVFAVLSLLRDLERGRPKIKNLVDLLLLLGAADEGMDWEAFLETRRHDGTFGPLINVLALCLEIADADDFAPRLCNVLEAHEDRRVPVRAAGAPFFFPPLILGLGNKLWCARVHDAPLALWLAWWSVSLPFRFAVHHRRRGGT
jgi:hypothetical protein